MKDKNFYIEFKIISYERFNCLQIMFEQLKKVKNHWRENADPEKEQYDLYFKDPVEDFPWLDYLDNEAKYWFQDTFDYQSEEGKIYRKLWDLTYYKHRLHPFFKTPGNWDFESMLDSIFHGDYDLIDLIKEKSDRGCLYYDPHGWPFGGSDSLCELIRSFGNEITYDSYHENNNPEIESQWNYDLAQKLVAKGIGFTPEILSV